MLLEQANAETDDNITPLLSAVAAGSLPCLELLLQAGANPNASAGGATPLHVAADNGSREIVSCLIRAGGDPNLCDDASRREADLPRSAILHKTEMVEVTPESKKRSMEAKSRGDDAFRKKDYQMAVDAYTQAIDLDPNEAALLSNRSLCWIRLGQGEQALADARACRALRPDWAKACYREGAALRLLQSFDEAASAFYEGVKLDPENKELVDAFRETVEAGRRFHGTEQQQKQ